MPLEFKIPEIGENIVTADIVKILVKPGDKVKIDQVVVELETDKANVEVPSENEGTVLEVLLQEGTTANVGDVLFTMEGEAKEVSKAPPEKKIEKEAEKAEAVQAPVKQEKKAEPASVSETKVPESKGIKPTAELPDISVKTVPAAPSVRRFAREIGVNIHSVKGSGPGGRIAIDDIKSFAKNLNVKIASSAASGMPIGISIKPLPDFTKWGDVKVEPMNNVRKKTAEHLSGAWVTIPHVTQFDKADITELEKTRKQYAKKAEAAGGKLTVTAILLKVVASALKVFPQFNSSIDLEKKEIIFKQYINIGVAVDTERGLLVPVIQNVDKKNIIELASELADLSEKARDKKLSLDEMQGGNFSISNLGGIGGTAFTPIVNSPEVAILGVSRGSYEQVYKDGEFVPKMMLPLSLSYDHRIIDGADGARFVRWIAEALENPLLISLEG